MGAAAMPVVFQGNLPQSHLKPSMMMNNTQQPRVAKQQQAPPSYNIQIKNMAFVPEHIRIEKGSTVTWQVCADTNSRSSSMFYGGSSRSHIISFDDIFVESPKLELAASSASTPRKDTFTMSFQDVGIFTYGCCIFSRMRGSIEVIENVVMMQYPMTQYHPWQD